MDKMLVTILAVILPIQVSLTDASNCREYPACSFPKRRFELPDPMNDGCFKVVCACHGTENGHSLSEDSRRHLESLKFRYTNCTLVEGNLEIVGTDDLASVIDFTQHIKEVTGYVLISRVYAEYIDLSSLILIRGRTLSGVEGASFCDGLGVSTPSPSTPDSESRGGYALFVTLNVPRNGGSQGLKQLWLPKLSEISQGNVGFQDNHQLCYIDTISWAREIFLNPETQTVNITSTFSIGNGRLTCPSCPDSCSDGVTSRCWGNSSALCQTFTRNQCSHCGSGSPRCTTGKASPICCNSECAAGCYGFGPSRCYACKNVNDDGVCKASCPYLRPLNPEQAIAERPDRIKYQLDQLCVDTCPANVPQTGGFCKKFCPAGEFDFDDNVCSTCEGGRCDHICPGLGQGPLKDAKTIHKNNIHHFSKNCTIIEGSLNFAGYAIKGDPFCALNRLVGRDLDVFANIREITGYLGIEDWISRDLCVFKNLQRIRGKELISQRFALFVATGYSALQELCFNSLKSIESGAVAIVSNPDLCHASSVDWNQFTNTSISHVIRGNQHQSRCGPQTGKWFEEGGAQFAVGCLSFCHTCAKNGCHSQCSAEGCWGDTSQQCVKCSNFTDNTDSEGQFTAEVVIDPITGAPQPGYNVTNCVAECNFNKGVYASPDKMCFPCHPECYLCTGPSSLDCRRCRNVKLNENCVPSCPEDYYVDGNQICQPCSHGCIDGGCNGPLNMYYPNNGCKNCYHHINSTTNENFFVGRRCSVCARDNPGHGCLYGCSSFNRFGPFKCYDNSSTSATSSSITANAELVTKPGNGNSSLKSVTNRILPGLCFFFVFILRTA